MNSRKLLERGYFQKLSNKLEKTTIVGGRYNGQVSDVSKSIINEGDIPLTIFNAFKLGDSNFELFKRGFDMITDGDGDETRKILTIHSSSLLALLCFFSVSENNPLVIDNDEYTEVLFEVKNWVLKKDNRKPSNIDVVLVSKSKDGSIRKLLFLESKFTEYVSHARVKLASKYKPFYNYLKEHIKDLQFNASYFNIRNQDGKTSEVFGLWADTPLYLEGIKQAFSHLLGIATGPAEDKNSYRKIYENYYYRAEKIEFGTILHNWNQTEFENYIDLYHNTFQHEDIIKKGLINDLNREIVDRLKINPEPFMYKKVFEEFKLPGIIREAYKL